MAPPVEAETNYAESIVVPVQTPDAGGTEDPAETEVLDQEGFPDEIKNKLYNSERVLVADLEKAGLIDDYRYIALTSEGRAYRSTPGIYHEEAIKLLGRVIKEHCGGTHGRLLCENNYQVKFEDRTAKFPDLAIFGEARSVWVEDGNEWEPKLKFNDQLGLNLYVNPDIIFEFSFGNKLHDEIPKFKKQMNEHLTAQGSIQVGFLIKAIPSKGRDDYPSEKDQSSTDNALCGFDVYELRGIGDEITPGQPTLQYRVGTNEDACLTVTDADLGRNPDDSGVYRIPLSTLRDKLERSPRCAVRFERKQGE